MKTKAFLPAIVFLLASLASCNSSVPKSLVTDDGSVRIIENPDGPLYICDLKAAGDTIDIPLSELVEDCRTYLFRHSHGGRNGGSPQKSKPYHGFAYQSDRLP